MKAKLIEKFVSIYGEGGEIRSFFSPGRVNLIGEHTDYNGGHVFPCALSIGTYMIVRKREDRTIRFYSENFSKLGVIETSWMIWYILKSRMDQLSEGSYVGNGRQEDTRSRPVWIS